VEFCIIGPDAKLWMQGLQKRYLPQVVFSGSCAPRRPKFKARTRAYQTSAYICRTGLCSPPFASLEKALQWLEQGEDLAQQ